MVGVFGWVWVVLVVVVNLGSPNPPPHRPSVFFAPPFLSPPSSLPPPRPPPPALFSPPFFLYSSLTHEELAQSLPTSVSASRRIADQPLLSSDADTQYKLSPSSPPSPSPSLRATLYWVVTDADEAVHSNVALNQPRARYVVCMHSRRRPSHGIGVVTREAESYRSVVLRACKAVSWVRSFVLRRSRSEIARRGANERATSTSGWERDVSVWTCKYDIDVR